MRQHVQRSSSRAAHHAACNHKHRHHPWRQKNLRQSVAALPSHPTRCITVSDAAAVRACHRFLDDHRVLVEPACCAALAECFTTMRPSCRDSRVLWSLRVASARAPQLCWRTGRRSWAFDACCRSKCSSSLRVPKQLLTQRPKNNQHLLLFDISGFAKICWNLCSTSDWYCITPLLLYPFDWRWLCTTMCI